MMHIVELNFPYFFQSKNIEKNIEGIANECGTNDNLGLVSR